ncbi:NYN domain-containing protein [Bradyrhizobium sp. AUGA SZCCT0177]|uniref:LabA-like NYN domain-containing protein n=1 Tax=Bradyrhizobium sp. AUGA SZCCT0177 TaxID=2807665 RepID=UPI001BAA8F9D|nr:NYN domain-containing protein [Bradyrhizobium sp. AUGA SZCCT0177]MBR1283039.1 NYN domain-containing protein [Bradyrhizobium sp. AUGA SZCCT0177]
MIPSEKLALFVDGPSLHHTAKGLDFSIDFKRLLAEFGTRGVLVRAYYYTIIAEEFKTTRPLIDWLDYNGFTVRTSSVKEFDDGQGRRKFKRNIGIELAVDALEIAKHVDHILLFSGDGDFRPLVKAIQRLGPRVTVVSSMRTKPAVVADELRRQADTFLELDDLKAAIGRTKEESRMRNQRDEFS